MENKSKGEFPFLPQHIIDVHILPRLPAKSLFRFKSVCQMWKTRISYMLPTPPNLVWYDHITLNLSFLLTNGSPIGEPDNSLEFLPRDRCSKMIASCNGLLVFRVFNTTGDRFYIYNPVTGEGDRFYIYNPVTGEVDLIPDRPLLENSTLCRFSGLDFDPLKANPCYKLVIPFMVHEFRNFELHLQVFSSETNKWEVSRTNIICSQRFNFDSQSFYICGLLYWKLELGYFEKILEFNPDGNQASLISFPFGTQQHEYARDKVEKLPYGDAMIGDWGGRLACTRIIQGIDMEVWIMNEHKQFSRMYSFGLETIPKERGIRICQLSCEGGKVVLFLVLGLCLMRLKVFSYDPKTRDLREFRLPDTVSPTAVLTQQDGCFIVYKKSSVPIPKRSERS